MKKGREFDHSKYQLWIDPNRVTPYEKNAKAHTEKQIKNIATSIKRFGWQQDTVLTKDNVCIIGHGRRLAAIMLGCEMPYHVVDKTADALTDKDIRELCIVDNQTSAETGFNFEMLAEEMTNLDFDGFDFDFDVEQADDNDSGDESDDGSDELIDRRDRDWTDERRNRVLDIVNLGKGQFAGAGRYDIPILQPVREIPPVTEWIRFDDTYTEKSPSGKGVLFFEDDYKFECVWSNPSRYIERLRQYACVATPDFSPYGDMPHALQIYNHYRKHWVGAYWQRNGITVIPTIRCSTDPRSLGWYLDGEPKGGVVIISAMWTSDDKLSDISMREYTTMRDKLKPSKILIYGKDTGNMGIDDSDPVEYIETMTEGRFGNGKK